MKTVQEFYGKYVETPEFFAKEGREYFVAKVPEDCCSYTRKQTYYIWTNCESYPLAHKEIKEFLKDDSITAGHHNLAVARGDLGSALQPYHEFSFQEDLDNKYEGYFVYTIVIPYDD